VQVRTRLSQVGYQGVWASCSVLLGGRFLPALPLAAGLWRTGRRARMPRWQRGHGCRTVRGKVHYVALGGLLRCQGHGTGRRGGCRGWRTRCAFQPGCCSRGPHGRTPWWQHLLPWAEGAGCGAPWHGRRSGQGRPEVGRSPVAIAITPNGATAYVANYLSGTVTPVNTATNTPAQRSRSGRTPKQSRSRPNSGALWAPRRIPTSPASPSPAQIGETGPGMMRWPLARSRV
jgi:hypothetical protein